MADALARRGSVGAASVLRRSSMAAGSTGASAGQLGAPGGRVTSGPRIRRSTVASKKPSAPREAVRRAIREAATGPVQVSEEAAAAAAAIAGGALGGR